MRAKGYIILDACLATGVCVESRLLGDFRLEDNRTLNYVCVCVCVCVCACVRVSRQYADFHVKPSSATAL